MIPLTSVGLYIIASVIVRSFRHLWKLIEIRGRSTVTREGQMLHPSSKQAKGTIWESIGLILISRTITWFFLKCIYECVKKVVLGKSADKIMLFLIAFYDEMTRPVDGGSAVDVFYLVFSMALDSLQNLLVSNVECYGLGCWTSRWVNS